MTEQERAKIEKMADFLAGVEEARKRKCSDCTTCIGSGKADCAMWLMAEVLVESGVELPGAAGKKQEAAEDKDMWKLSRISRALGMLEAMMVHTGGTDLGPVTKAAQLLSDVIYGVPPEILEEKT